jgi:hypothetical protein
VSEPIQRDGQWWTRAGDGSWLRWDADAYRWEPHPGPPPVQDAAGVETPVRDAAGVETPAGVVPERLRDFDPIDGKATIAIVLIALATTAAAVQVPLLAARASSEFLKIGAVLSAITTLDAFAFVGAGIAFLAWYTTAYNNLAPLGATNLRYKPGWSIGGWLIPIANLFIPKQITNDLWRASDPALPPDQGEHWKLVPISPVLNLWWACWVIAALLSGGGMGLNTNIYGTRTALRLAAASQAFIVVAGLALIVLVRQITARQYERARAFAPTSPKRARALGLIE